MKRLVVFTILILLAVIVALVIGVDQYALHHPTPLVSPLSSAAPGPQPETQSHPYTVYGYLPYWTAKTAQLPPILTHVGYFSVEIQPDGHFWSPPDTQAGSRAVRNGVLEQLLSELSPQKTELVLTMMDQTTIPEFLTSSSASANFVSDLHSFTKDHPLDGINVDIEYIQNVNSTMQQHLTEFVHQVSLYTHAQTPPLHLSIAVMGDSGQKMRLTDPKGLAPLVDHMIIMAYDYHRKTSIQSGANAPLYGSGEIQWGTNIMAGLKGFTDVVPSRKLLLGVPFYGYEWSVDGSDVSNPTFPKSGKTATYERITQLLSSGKATRYFDPDSLSPYIFYQNNGVKQQIFYDDPQSLGYKLDLVKQANLGGIAIWALGFEGQTSELWKTIETKLGLTN